MKIRVFREFRPRPGNLVPTLRVGTPGCDALRRVCRSDGGPPSFLAAERPTARSHAERGNEFPVHTGAGNGLLPTGASRTEDLSQHLPEQLASPCVVWVEGEGIPQ